MKGIKHSGKASLAPLWGIFLASLLLAGGFHECSAAAIALALLAHLLYRARRSASFVVSSGMTMLALVIYPLSMGLTAIWGVDHNVYGLVKFLPLPLFALALQQDCAGQDRLLHLLPEIGASLVVLSCCLQLIPDFREWLIVAGRLAGVFAYPNTFAALLLACVIPLFFTERPLYRTIPAAAVLLTGIGLTGSRTVFVLCMPVLLALLIMGKNKVAKLVVLGELLLAAAALAAYFSRTGEGLVLRILSISPGASTFLGRLLYAKDVIPVILSHPFGLGYLGYAYLQGSFQTGVYSVTFLHNDWLQFFADVGWFPAVWVMAAVIRSLCSSRSCAMKRLVMFTICAHSLFDFDLQFVGMWFVLILTLDLEDGKRRVWKLGGWPRRAAIPLVVAALCLYLGVANLLYYCGSIDLAIRLLPDDTRTNLAVIAGATKVSAAHTAADRILARNRAVSAAWDIQAKAAFTQGDFGSVIECFQNRLRYAPYERSAYEEYISMLAVGIDLYRQSGDLGSAEICTAELAGIPARIEAVLENTDALAWRLTDKPELALDEQSLATLRQYLGGA